MGWLILVLGVLAAGILYAILRKDIVYLCIFFFAAFIIAVIFTLTNNILCTCIEKTDVYDIEEYSLIPVDAEKNYLIYNTNSNVFSCLTKNEKNFLETKTISTKDIKINDSESKNPRLIIEHKQVDSPLVRFLFFFDSTESYKIYIPCHSTKYIEGD